MEISKIIKKVIFESDGVEEFYGVESYRNDVGMEQELKKIMNVLRPFIRRIDNETMFIIQKNKKAIIKTLKSFMEDFLGEHETEKIANIDIEKVITEKQISLPAEYDVQNEVRLLMFLVNLFSNYIYDFEDGNERNQYIIDANKKMIKSDLINLIGIYLEEPKEDMNENKNLFNILSTIKNILKEEFGDKNFLYEDIYGSVEEVNLLQEAEYQGRKVQLGKIMQGDIKKFKVYVKNDKGKVVKVNFGFGGKSAKGKRMTIKKNNPERRRSFRARHNCDNPGPRWKPRYWACRTW